jgi:hypothetical protein
MARPADFLPILLSEKDEALAREQATFNPDNPFAWVGLAAEHAFCGAFNAKQGDYTKAWRPQTYAYDVALQQLPGEGAEFQIMPPPVTRVEMKTRVASAGWTDPACFEWIGVPTHEGREPIKDVDLVLFCWWSASEPRRLWVLGKLLGVAEFKRRAVFYREGEWTPRGGPAPKGGTWILDVSALRPLPRGLLKVDR